MRYLILLVFLAGATGCGNSSAPSAPKAAEPKKPDDPTIKVREAIGGGAGPLNGGRSREYEGPVSQAPDWAKPKGGGK